MKINHIKIVSFVSIKHTHESEHENGSEWVNLAQCLTITDTKPTSEWNSVCKIV